MRNLRQEYIHAQNEVKRIASIPLMIGHFLEGIDATTCIVAPTSGQNFYVRILSTVDREKLKPSAAVCLHKFSHSLVDVLPPESDSSIQDRFDPFSNHWKIFGFLSFSVNRNFRSIEAFGVFNRS